MQELDYFTSVYIHLACASYQVWCQHSQELIDKQESQQLHKQEEKEKRQSNMK